MPDITLNFPLQPGGEEEGFNDAGIETFEGDVGDYIARECGQNTSDASENGSAELHFDLLDMPIANLPCLDKLGDVFNKCKAYWESDPKAVKFFDHGLSCLAKDTLPVLKISDYGTSGLTGEDTDRTSKWFTMVRSKGACNKGEGAGGSFGIGKYAPFAASALRTVYYYTKTQDNDAFQGISRLVTHSIDEETEAQATGYIGEYTVDGNKHKYLSIRDRDCIDSHFLRDEKEIGTDIYIPAYREVENWKQRLIISVLNNFWPAICLKRIVFNIGGFFIDHTNIDTCIEKNKKNDNFTAFRYFNAYRIGQSFKANLNYVGDSELRLVIDSERKSNPIAVARQNGMIIEKWGHFRSRKPISGIFICHDPDGNEVLRRLEPPRHDKWDPKRSENGKKVLNTIKEWIRSCIDEMLPTEETESFDLDIFSRFIPDEPDEDEGEDAFSKDDEPENHDGFESTPTTPKRDITKTPVKPASSEPDDDGEEAALDEGDGDVETGGGGENSGKGTGGNGGGQGEGGGSGGTGTTAASTASVRVLDLRTIYHDADGAYDIIIRTKKKFDGKISFAAECDDGTAENILLDKVLLGSQEIPLLDGGKAFQAVIETDAPQTYKAYFVQTGKIAVRIV